MELTPRNRQNGAGLLTVLMAMAAVVLSVMVTIRLLPYYLDDYALSRVLQSLDRAQRLSAPAVRAHLVQGLERNRIALADDELRVRTQGDQLDVAVRYERRVALVYNIDFVLTFEHDWKVKAK